MYQLVRRRQTDPALEFLTTPGVWPEKSRIHAGFRRIAPSVIRCYSAAVNREFLGVFLTLYIARFRQIAFWTKKALWYSECAPSATAKPTALGGPQVGSRGIPEQVRTLKI